MITGNKGEWSEIYTLFKLLGDGKVHAGDADMNKLPLYYPILNVVREESKNYEYKPDSDKHIVIINGNGEELARISMNRFLQESQNLLENIKAGKGNGAFSIPSAENFMEEVYCEKLKAKSADKADIHIVIHDLRTNMTPMLGFSIKSQLGSPSTLLNAGTTTNIAYRIVGSVPMDADGAASINSINDHIPRIQAIYNQGYELQFAQVKNSTFENNLLFLDSCMPEFIARCLIVDSRDSDSSVRHAVEEVAKQNPFGYKGNVLKYYEHKMKQLLLASALGMTPAKEWTGRFDANGGYLVVRKDGEIVCYHFYNQNDVEDYLYNNTRFERASRSRYDFGMIYCAADNTFKIDLNLQIRFKK
jgi:HpaII restriction endonuclease.